MLDICDCKSANSSRPRAFRSLCNSGIGLKYDATLRASSTIAMSVMPASTASSTAYWISGFDRTGKRALGTVRVTGKNRVPKPATGITAFVMCLFCEVIFNFSQGYYVFSLKHYC